jgi:hypothetical protein
MAELGDLKDLFKNHVPNLDWLDVDENVYRELERLPKQNLDIRPDLEELWTTHDKGSIHFVPNIDLSAFPELNRKQAKVSAEDVARVVARHVKDKMMSGWTGKQVSAWIKEHVDSQAIAALMPMFKRIAAEQGVLGTVYIDATDWKDCDQGEGEKIARQAKLAKYVLANAEKCAGCIFKEGGRCSKFRKELVFDVVPYSDDMVDEYASVLKVSPPVSTASEAPKERIRTMVAMVQTDAPMSVEAKDKPVMGPQEKRDRKAAQFYEPPPTAFVSTEERLLYRDLAQKMMVAKGRFSENLRVRLAIKGGSEAVATLRAEENLLGNLYVRPDQFDSCHQANDALRKHANTAPYVLEIPNKCHKCSFFREGSCSLLGKKVVREMPYTKEFLANEVTRLVDAGKLTQKVADNLLARTASEPIHDLVREAHTVRPSKPVAAYSGKSDDLVNMGSATAGLDVTLDPNAIPFAHRDVVAATYKAVYEGLEGPRLKNELVGRFGTAAVMAAATQITNIVRLAGLLGNVIVDLRGFRNVKEAASFLAANKMKPAFLLKEGCCNSMCGGEEHEDTCKSHQFKGMEVIQASDLDSIPADYTANQIAALSKRGRIASDVATDLLARIGTDSTADLLREAYLAKPKKTTLASVNVNPVTEYHLGPTMSVEVDAQHKVAELDVGFDDPLGTLNDDV